MSLMGWQQGKRHRAGCSVAWRYTLQRAACSPLCNLVLQHHSEARSSFPAVQSSGCPSSRLGRLQAGLAASLPTCPTLSLREDCRGNTAYVVSAANAGCSQDFNEALRVKCRSNLLIALRGRQIALNHSFLSCKLIKEYRGAFK